MIRKSESGFISKFGHLKGLENLPEYISFEAIPYIAAKRSYEASSENFPKFPASTKNVGVDFKFGISSNFTLEATFSPDFGQVEADPAVLNLTTYETFYPEKRPFFIEGTQILRFTTFGGQFGPGLFYSRRIGRAISEHEIILPVGWYIKNLPKNVTIVGAAKLTGKTNNGLSIGLLQAITKQENALISDSSGNQVKQLIEPPAHYNVIRLKQDIAENSNFGWIFTSVSKKYQSPIFTSGIDWNFKLFDNAYSLDGFIAGSYGWKYFRRIDGTAGKINFGKISGENWLWNTSFDYTSNNYNINDLGFFMRPKDFGTSATITYKIDYPTKNFLESRTSIFLHERRSFEGYNLIREISLNSYFLFYSYWRSRSRLRIDFGTYDDRETRGNGLYKKPVTFTIGSFIRSDDRKIYVLDYNYDFIFDNKKNLNISMNSKLSYVR